MLQKLIFPIESKLKYRKLFASDLEISVSN